MSIHITTNQTSAVNPAAPIVAHAMLRVVRSRNWSLAFACEAACAL
eukprot:CAMPEP_0172044772 /NCGR_PEP_ID=MMETSP1041-20130122/26973_1 /TAXON_ID=464988 /ORGANISM="Hemiselmis andersenii, Strain CCMP439" /LENGTH=45 /DNA_ID= /DNA_START= /DNA_END= /DNA_ORIENTATION=